MEKGFASLLRLRLSPPISGRWRPGWKDCCSGGSCWRSQECSALLLSRVLCCRLCLCLTLQEKKWQGMKWSDTLRSASGQLALSLALRERHRRSTYCCCGTPPLLGCCWNICTYWFVSVHMRSQNVRRLDDSLLPRHLWWLAAGVRGKRDLRLFLSFPFKTWLLLGWRLHQFFK